MREIRLHGALADLVGAERLDLEVAGPAELVRALVLQVPGARQVIEASDWIVVDGNREIVPAEVLVRRPNGGPLELIPVLAGAGSTGRAIGKVFAGLFLLGAAIVIGPIGAGLLSGGWATFIGGAGATLALSGVSQILAPTPQMDYQAPEAADQRQSFLFAGTTNLTTPGNPVPVVYGTVRTGSIVLGTGFTATRRFSGDWGISTTQPTGELLSDTSARFIDALSEGEIEGFTRPGRESILLDDVRAEESAGGSNFPSLVAELVRGVPGATEPLDQAGRRVFGVQLSPKNADGTTPGADAGAIERTITDSAVTDAIVTIRIPRLTFWNGSAFVDTDVPWLIEVSANGGAYQTANAPLRIWDGTHESVGGTPNDMLAGRILLSTAPITITGIAFQIDVLPTFLFDPAQAAVTFTLVDTTTADEYPKTFTVPFTDHPTQPYITTDRSFVMRHHDIPPGVYDVYVDTSAMPWNPGGAIAGVDVRVLYYDENGNWGGWPGNQVLSDSGFEEDFLVRDLQQYGQAPWTLRVKRLKIDSTDPNRQDLIIWDRYQEVIRGDLLMPDTARVQLSLDSQDTGGSVPRRAYEIKGVKIEVPSNLDTTTRIYSGVWDGTFKPAREWYDNPAWCLWDLLRSERYGLGLAEDEIDRWSLYDAAKYCDEFVDDGEGGTEPRFLLNYTLATRESAFEVVRAVAAVMQCQVWIGQGKVFVTQDRPDTVVRAFTAANVIGGVFDYSSAADATRYSRAKVSWRNPELGYGNDVDIVDRPYLGDRFGVRELDILAIGATSYGQARRRGRYDLLTAELESGTVKFRVGLESALVEPGQLIEIYDPWRAEVGAGGRVAEYTTNGSTFWAVTLDRPLEDPVGGTFKVLLSDGTLFENISDNYLDNPPRVFLAGAPASDPLPGAPWIQTVGGSRIYRAFSITTLENAEYEIEAIEHDPTKQAAVENYTDIGAPINLPTPDPLGLPVVDPLWLTFDAETDRWSVHGTFSHPEPERVAMSRVTISVPVGVFDAEQYVTGLTVSQDIGLHDDVKTSSAIVRVHGRSADGSLESNAGQAGIPIPDDRP